MGVVFKNYILHIQGKAAKLGKYKANIRENSMVNYFIEKCRPFTLFNLQSDNVPQEVDRTINKLGFCVYFERGLGSAWSTAARVKIKFLSKSVFGAKVIDAS